MSEIKVNKITPRTGTTITLGDSGDSLSIASGVSLTDFTSTGIDDNATSTALTIDSSGNVGIGTTSPSAVLDLRDETNGANFIVGGSGTTNITKIGGGAGDSVTVYSNSTTPVATFSTSGNTLLEGSLYLGGETSSANALDDYEEGTWTPTTNAGTVVGTDCKYTKVGRKVFVQGRFDTFSDRTSAVAIYINDLPFAQSSTQTSTFSLMYRYINTNTNFHSIVGFCPSGGSQVTFYEVGDNQNWSQLLHNQLASAISRIYFSATYTTD